ncbi:hypothetical protein GQX73_g7920 [Xylaria multiplex]|uniref:Uncharacterized protein n=1 Tax=Xylaria multiplex TaxID=323545 RepID=A0A7C8IMY7_9PEZI|nr:hypothetical protein GQX73_g7920 [Xylaria multiplex]
MAVSLQFVKDGKLSALDRYNLKVLSATLRYPTNAGIKSTKLAEDIKFIVNANNAKEGTSDILLYVWSLILEISKCIPPDHPWQDSLLQAIGYLGRQDGTVPGMVAGRWEDLPYLSIRIRELWDDPTEEGEEGVEEGEFTRWKNQNSFVARLTSAFFDPGSTFPIWQLRTALEEPPTNGPAEECRLWVACEWVIRCSRIIHKNMDSGLSDDAAFSTGSLCRDVPHFSIDRWNFWKKRFAEISVDAKKLDVGPAVVARMSKTMEIMEGIGK